MNHDTLMKRSWVVYSLFCLTIWLVNVGIYHYPSNHHYDMFEEGFIRASTQLALMAYGLSFFCSADAQTVRLIKEIMKCIIFFALIFEGVTLIQFTPFPLIDRQLVWLDSLFHVDVGKIVAWMHTFPRLRHFFDNIYYWLDVEMVLAPLLAIIFRRYALLQEYYAYWLISALLGFILYYLFPTTAPASVFSSPYFMPDQYATGIKFEEMHHYFMPSTSKGGLVSFPSFHVIWAWFSMYLLRWHQGLFIVLFCLNVLIALSCVLMGWHYFVDILGSVGVIVLTHWIYSACVGRCRLGLGPTLPE